MIKKKLLVGTLIAAITTLIYTIGANAADSGGYIGIQGGWSNTHWGDETLGIGIDSSTDTTGIAGRAYLGYQFNPNFATELGFLWPSNATNKLDSTGFKVTAKEQIGDLALKGILPLANNFFAYGKVGAAFLHATVSGNATGLGIVSRDIQNEVYPLIGVGIGYYVTPNIPIDISYMRIQSVTGNDNIPSVDFYAAGIAYVFG